MKGKGRDGGENEMVFTLFYAMLMYTARNGVIFTIIVCHVLCLSEEKSRMRGNSAVRPFLRG